MRGRMLTVATLCGLIVLAVACQRAHPLAPSPVGTLEDFLQALQRQGRSVTLAGELPRESNPFFSVPAHVVLVDQSHLNVFQYSSADAARVRPDGSAIGGTQITWISTPPFVIGHTPCHRVN